ncbi:MAG: aminotransferase class III-fold pyridoxal phosphate-dependent enzyme [Phycisphaeraceae bacterium]
MAPRLNALMRVVGMDVAYQRAEGAELFYEGGDGDEVAVLDLVGGYGSLLLGHHHPALVGELTRFLAAGLPVHAQGSLRPVTQRLAAALSKRVADQLHSAARGMRPDTRRGYNVVLANSGSEAIETAIKHAVLQTGGRTLIALDGAFHGKTIGAMQLAGDASHRETFEASGLTPMNVLRVRLNDIDHLEEVFAKVDAPAGFFFEPVQGEGGVHPVTAAFARRAAALCKTHHIPLIADECQTGMGRTGRFLACEHLGVQPDYIVLSKALGGGLAKIAALLVRQDQYDHAFDLKHTSTFAGDELSSAVALKALELTDDHLLAEVRAKGCRWLAALVDLAERYPDIIAEVRGQGLMLAIELRPLNRSESFMVRMLSATDDLAVFAAGYLLREHHVRVAPTLGRSNTLRLQPAAMTSTAQMNQAIDAIERLCQRLRQADAPSLTSHLAAEQDAQDNIRQMPLRDTASVCTYRPSQLRAGAPESIRRVAWLCHLIDDADLVSLEPAFARWCAADRNRLLDRLAPWANPVVMSEVDVRSLTGQVVRLHPIMLPITSAWMWQCIDAEACEAAAALVQKGVDVARQLGCEMTALGQYTSIVTRGGRRLHAQDMGLSTGNTYSLALALEAIRSAERQHAIDPASATCAVVGAAGNIGQTAARLLAHRYRHTLLLGNPASAHRRSATRLDTLAHACPNMRVIHDPAQLRDADVVLAATSAVDQPISVEHLRHSAVVCDLSVPATVSEAVSRYRTDVTLIKGGIARLPFEEDLQIVGFPLPIGRTYGCLGEALLLGFEGERSRSFTGLVRPEQVQRIAGLAQRHGFMLDQYKDHCVLGTQSREVAHVGVA